MVQFCQITFAIRARCEGVGMERYGVPALAGSTRKCAMILSLIFALEDANAWPAKAGTPYLFDNLNENVVIEALHEFA
jgi:hypothetical protein